MGEETNVYIEELKKMVGKEVIVSYMKGSQLLELKGIVKALSFNYLHMILMTKDDKILIKNFVDVTRKRNV